MGRSFVRSLVCAGSIAALAAACSGTTGPNGTGAVSLSLATGSGTVSPDVRPSFSLTQTNGSNSLVIDSAMVVLRKIELEAQDGTCPGTGSPTEGDGCEEFEAGPVLVSLPLDGTVDQAVSVNAPAGTYDKLQFQVHAPTADSADQAFVTDHPAYDSVSLRVVGSYNGNPFTFTSHLDAEQEVELNPALVVDGSSTSTNVTLHVDVSTWFVAPDSSLIDPSTALRGQPNQGVVTANIEHSMHAFEDDNHDGEADH
ncbi:MAG: hypothetical protein Q8W51_05230 [Candidatus Palauibacterales bacterium]|nr:hypothetical protein [Candidatus Palauibacterales bacterium]MDP2529119.1 hypothetical protein [Candidatus Palauibacterales bacterium]MDP2583934.1 hypothetical protein [Candidatus Palauibacterales bacterium]